MAYHELGTKPITWTNADFDGLVQERLNSIANPLELCLSLN